MAAPIPALKALALMAVACAATGGRSAVAQNAAPNAAQPVRQVVLDIISFARWPEPRSEIRFCIVGQPLHAGGFFDGELRTSTTPVQPQRAATGDERLATACDVVYGGALTPGERDQVGRTTIGRPILTIGEAGPGCGETTMFCLQVVGIQVSFATNLDAIARSGIRVNPKVLLLGRRPPAPGLK